MTRVLVTGSTGLIGSEAVRYFGDRGWTVHGVDNNMRQVFFGPDGDTTANRERLVTEVRGYTHHSFDVRDRREMLEFIRDERPHLIFHCAAQPSHDLAKDCAFDDFEINAVGTLNLLEAARQYAPESPFVFMSTNKVYGDAPNEKGVVELETRWDYAEPADREGIDETCRIDRAAHSLFGASKLAADLLVQEYGRYFQMPTVCLRSGCVTGARHAAAELHGFLAYLARAIKEERPYRIYGYKGKQVRDNVHAYDVCRWVHLFYEQPRMAAVYNIGGGRANSLSILEAVDRLQVLIGKRLRTQYVDRHRVGDHICYISDLRRIRADYPAWRVSRSLDDILRELAEPC